MRQKTERERERERAGQRKKNENKFYKLKNRYKIIIINQLF